MVKRATHVTDPDTCGSLYRGMYAVSCVNFTEWGPPVADPHLGKRRENICSIHYKAYALHHGIILFINNDFSEREFVVQIGA